MNIGDTVQLKSGGPTLTIIETVKPGFVKVTWFNQTNTLSLATLPTEALQAHERVTYFVGDEFRLPPVIEGVMTTLAKEEKETLSL